MIGWPAYIVSIAGRERTLARATTASVTAVTSTATTMRPPATREDRKPWATHTLSHQQDVSLVGSHGSCRLREDSPPSMSHRRRCAVRKPSAFASR